MVTFLPTPLGNLRDISFRTIDTLQEASLFLCEDTRVTRRLLHLLHERGMLARFPEGEFLSFNEHNGPSRLAEVAPRLREERAVYLSDAGMPGISDPGQLLVAHCQKEGIDYDVLPGPSAVVTAYAASGFPSGRFSFYGFLPHEGRERREALREVMRQRFDTVLYEAPHRLEKLLSEIVERDPERELFAAKELSKQHQRYYRGTAPSLKERILAEGEIRGEWVVILRGKRVDDKVLHLSDILEMDLPPKPKAKLLSRLSGESTGIWYERLTKGSSSRR
ncbi:16S rRNA (cytidine(1402)-2'-O)-methyltransferase [Nitratifractor sp.]